ncbi:hypothetical protein FPQ18DRAFT_408823 [Pyronema domesticum]|uniref:Uncharacterized protein n=1 Tax=Pyronema omphalodes (strain CBS 100304) TaxID=1076935 RepID=U4LND5_PYROM|nr:hypothetical protein FPQ18DRAFT_408823 [Pyronema domesticum]CCX30830.1 Protein of unknown function [Pyronema omphalodes CBS 100304]
MKCFHTYLVGIAFILASVVRALALTNGSHAVIAAPTVLADVMAAAADNFKYQFSLGTADVDVAAISTDTVRSSSVLALPPVAPSVETGLALPTRTAPAEGYTNGTTPPHPVNNVSPYESRDENTGILAKTLATRGKRYDYKNIKNPGVHGGIKYEAPQSPKHPAPSIYETDFVEVPEALGYKLDIDGKIHHGNLWPGSLDRKKEVVHLNLNAMMPMAKLGPSRPEDEIPEVVYESVPTTTDCPAGTALTPSGECVAKDCPASTVLSPSGECVAMTSPVQAINLKSAAMIPVWLSFGFLVLYVLLLFLSRCRIVRYAKRRWARWKHARRQSQQQDIEMGTIYPGSRSAMEIPRHQQT